MSAVNAGTRVARLGLLVASLALTSSLAALQAQPLHVGPNQEFATIGGAVASARPGDTVLVAAGTYPERLRIEAPLTLIGVGWPVVDGEGGGHVIETSAPLVLEGFVIRGSGEDVVEEHAGVMVREAPGTRIVGNRLEDVFYGIYLKDSQGSVVSGNRIEGKPFLPPRRGDGIRLWYSSASEILENIVRGTRDVVIYFSDSLLVRGNVIEDGRYGLHYMYSNHNVFERNRFDGNEVGAFLMYSTDIRLRENVFANSAGMSGMGIGFKDSDAIEASGNLIVGNVVGIHLDNSPHSVDVTNSFTGNLLLANQAGIRLLPSVRRNVFEGNDFLNNGTPVVVAGGAGPDQAARNGWSKNHWSEYAGFDRDGDGAGDLPFVHARLADDLLSRHPALALFARSPALGVLEIVSRFFPLLRPEPVVVDSAPRIDATLLAEWGEAAGAPMRSRPSPWKSASWLLLAAAGGGALWRVTRRRPS